MPGGRRWPWKLRAAQVGLIGLAFCATSMAASAPVATAAPGMFVGVTEDAFRWRTADAIAVARDLGLEAVRVTLVWAPGQSRLEASDARELDPLVTAGHGLRLVLTVTGRASAAPRDEAARTAFCDYVRDVLDRYPSVNDVVVWNEPNLGYFWQPQFDGRASVAPGAYAALLARCWDVVHQSRPAANLITSTSPRGSDDPAAVVNPSHSPGAFVRKLGAAYRASARERPLFDTIGHNPYGSASAEPPWATHLAATHIAQGDLDRLVEAYADGFRDTAQAVPGRCVAHRCATVWYLEAGYQSLPDEARRAAYLGRETDAGPAREHGGITQSAQLADGIRLAYCQPHVAAFFNFLLWDEPELARWQSGVLWTDGALKASYGTLRAVIDEVRGRRTDCAALWARAAARPTGPRGDALVERIEWTPVTRFSSFNEVWWFGLGVRADATYKASVVRLARTGRRAVLAANGSMRARRSRLVHFPARALRPGRYRIDVLVTSRARPRLSSTRRSPVFVVE